MGVGMFGRMGMHMVPVMVMMTAMVMVSIMFVAAGFRIWVSRVSMISMGML